MHKKSDDEPPTEVVQDNHLLGVMFVAFLLMQIAWILRPIYSVVNNILIIIYSLTTLTFPI